MKIGILLLRHFQLRRVTRGLGGEEEGQPEAVHDRARGRGNVPAVLPGHHSLHCHWTRGEHGQW